MRSTDCPWRTSQSAKAARGGTSAGKDAAVPSGNTPTNGARRAGSSKTISSFHSFVGLYPTREKNDANALRRSSGILSKRAHMNVRAAHEATDSGVRDCIARMKFTSPARKLLPLDDSIFFAMSSQPEPSESDFLTNRVYACAALGQRFIGNSAFILKMSPSLSDMYSTKSSDAKRESTRASRLPGRFVVEKLFHLLRSRNPAGDVERCPADENGVGTPLGRLQPAGFQMVGHCGVYRVFGRRKIRLTVLIRVGRGKFYVGGSLFPRRSPDFFAGTAVFWETFFFAAAGCAGTGFCAADFCAPPNAKCAEQIREKTPNALKNILPLSIYPDCSFMANRNLGARQDFFMSHSGEFSV